MIWHCEFQKKDHFWVINISMATHNQMTLILRNLKFILFIYSFSKYYCHATCRSYSSYFIIVLQ